jgi:serine/threonine protein kinase
VRPLGSGAGGTVFVVRRIEDRHNDKAEHFALKVPDYDGNAARSLSEEQFMQLFREEATALLGLPGHPNLARFVTFDLAARPKPILVMELVEGLSLDQLLTAGPLDRPRALAILDGVLAGLEAMHGTGIGHLDIKPQNVILRGGEVPVLVDFGLSGRTLRPGCGSLAYSAPEIWLGSTEGVPVSPSATDIYAVACLAFELLVGEPLFPATSEVAAIATHLAHDGWPPGLQARRGALGPLATTLHDALRRSPSGRLSAAQLRQHLRAHR